VGLTAREIADYLGHAQVSTTQDVYMNRQVSGGAAAAALEVLAIEK
jgi:integrase